MRHDRHVLVLLALLVRVHAHEEMHARDDMRRGVGRGRERKLGLAELQRMPKVEEVVHAWKG